MFSYGRIQEYVLCIPKSVDKQGFPMKQGILTNGRVRLLLKKGTTCYRPRKDVSILKPLNIFCCTMM